MFEKCLFKNNTLDTLIFVKVFTELIIQLYPLNANAIEINRRGCSTSWTASDRWQLETDLVGDVRDMVNIAA